MATDSQALNFNISETDVAHDPGAWHYVTHHDMTTLMAAFTLANILHTDSKPFEASRFYRLAFDRHSGNPAEYPRPEALLQARLLCLLKAGHTLPEHELAELYALSHPMGDYISGIRMAWTNGAHTQALQFIGNAYESFHTGEEADCRYLEVALQTQYASFAPATRAIPPHLYMFWDKAPPPEIEDNIDYHETLDGLARFKIYDRDEAADLLYDSYGIEARTLFLESRHPAEAADFFRVHAIALHGGWWLDADLRLRSADSLASTAEHQFFITPNFYVHNDFFGAIPGSPVLNDCLLSLYRNSYQHRSLFIAYKTGPGIFNRAVNRMIHRNIRAPQPLSMVISPPDRFSDAVEEFETPYKLVSPNWQTA
ncbi:glycosyltransferase family 32 protein [Acidomonas methanolica]|uniref:hypothetical protein n=1 Tax=Acidomonas methanolica TaxID=437 RepID=UPI00211A66A0|nr:hypothetical protein [Acidomonas methanolica]MCQ9154094.1 hypothetical protein [Acidomonas methanolica]